MWNFDKITLRRFQSHPHTEYKFERDKAVMVVGQNLDEDSGQESNGSGKSALLEALVFVLLGMSLRGVRNVELIQDETGEASVELEMSNTLTDEVVIIERAIFAAANKPERVSVFVNGKPPRNPLTSTRHANEYILELLDITKEDLLNYYLIHRENYQSFLTSTDGAKKAIINRFSKADAVDQVFPEIDNKLRGVQAVLNTQQSILNAKESRIEVLQHTIAAYDFDSVKQERKAQEDEIKGMIKQAEEDLQGHKDSQALKDKEAARIGDMIGTRKPVNYSNQITASREYIAKWKRESLQLKKDRLEAENLLHATQLELRGMIECPECHHEFNPSIEEEALPKKDLEDNIKEINLAIKEIDEELNTLAQKVETEERSIRKTETAEHNANMELRRLEQERDNYVSEAGVYFRHAERSREQIRRYSAQLETLQNKPLLDPTIEYQEELRTIESTLKPLEEAMAEKRLEYAQHQEWVERFKAFKSQLANAAISSLNGYINLNLQKIHSNLQIELSGYRMLASKNQLKEEITATVLRNGLPEGSYKKFSSGERARIDICTILTQQELINASSKTGGLNFLALDEVMDSVDGKGLYNVLHAVNLLERSIMVVTLGNFTSEYEHKVIVRKTNKESRILIKK